MEILEPGRPQRGWATEVRCTGHGNGGGGCGARLRVDQGDLYMTYSSHYDGSNESYVTFTCAACGVETDLKNVPSGIQTQLPSKQKYFEDRSP